MKNTYFLKAGACIAVAATTLLASCVSSTQIRSIPSGAAVYADQQPIGHTPCRYADTKIVGMATEITLKMDGYQDLDATIVRTERPDVGAIVGGFFFFVPFLWTMGYNPVHQYELEPLGPASPAASRGAAAQGAAGGSPGADAQGSTTELVKLKALLDAKSIDEGEFTTLKVAILQGGYDYAHSPADQVAALRDLRDRGLLTQAEYDGQKAKAIEARK
jgi:hypothetical protein